MANVILECSLDAWPWRRSPRRERRVKRLSRPWSFVKKTRLLKCTPISKFAKIFIKKVVGDIFRLLVS